MLLLSAIVLAVVVACAVAVGTVFVVGMRRKSPIVLRLVRGFARRVVNPRMLTTAGTPGAQASVVHHVGRRTGRAYRTPVDARPTEDGFVVALPYGTTANWVRNVLAAGSAVVVHEGLTHHLDRPELVPLADVAGHFPVEERRNLDRFRVDRCMRLRIDPHTGADPLGDARRMGAGRTEVVPPGAE